MGHRGGSCARTLQITFLKENHQPTKRIFRYICKNRKDLNSSLKTCGKEELKGINVLTVCSLGGVLKFCFIGTMKLDGTVLFATDTEHFNSTLRPRQTNPTGMMLAPLFRFTGLAFIGKKGKSETLRSPINLVHQPNTV